jgi:hypothetical protein
VPAWMALGVAALVFGASLAMTVRQHIRYLTGGRPAEFFAFLETSGWMVLLLTSGAALFRLSSGALTLSAGVVGAVLVAIGSLLRSPDRGRE